MTSSALLQAWEKTLRTRGPQRAVVQAADGRGATFQELDAGANTWLEAVASADRIALRGRAVVFAEPNGIRWLEIFLGLLRAGAVAVPLDSAEPPAARRRLAESLRAGIWWEGARLVPLERARRFSNPEIRLIKLTSGTTGQPRPLVFASSQLLADARQVTATMGISARDLNYALIPLGHSYGLGNLSIPLVAQGIPLVCGAAPLPHAIAEDFQRWHPTVFPSVPAVWRALAASDLKAAALASLRLGVSAGAPLDPAVARDFAARFGKRLHAFYGSSETGGIAFDRTGEATLGGGVGRPMQGVTISPQRGQRIRISSAAVFIQDNRRQRGKNGAWVPPDQVASGRDGLTILGRRGTTVKIGGRRLNPTEIAARLRQIPGVNDAWVGAQPGPEPLLGAAVATSRSIAELRTALHADTASWKIPRKWLILPELPLTARGKTDVRALQARVFAGGTR
jgi:acyl-CoA synthetase (AMP-forming)/AMP-acid ligase II